jgi:hypothetical protein
MKPLALPLVAGLSAALACSRTPSGPEALSEAPWIDGALATNEKVQFDEINFVPCADGGAGEDVEVAVKLHILMAQTTDASGGLHLTFHFQDAGSRGVGLITGSVYRRVGVTRQTENVAASGIPAEFTFVNIFDFIAPGPRNNFQIHDLIHVTVTKNGVTAEVVKSTVLCR